MQNSPQQQPPKRGSSLLARIDNGDNLLEVMNSSLNNNLLQSQKQNIKELKVKPVEKTQRIKKDKKAQKKSLPKEENSQNEVDQFQTELVDDAVHRLRLYLQNPDSYGVSKYRGMDEQSLLQFLQLIELQYSESASTYLSSNINKTTCGNLKGVLSRFVNEILSSFPVLQKLVYYMAVEHYNCGVQQRRFDRLMNKSITPIIHVKSQNYLRVECSDWYLDNHTPDGRRQDSLSKQQRKVEAEEEMEPSFQSEGDTLKVDKKKRKNKKKKEKKEKREEVEDFPEPQQRDESLEELLKFLDGLNIKQDERMECRIEEQLLQHWRGRIGRLVKPVEKMEK